MLIQLRQGWAYQLDSMIFHVFFLLRMEQEALHLSLLALALEKEQVGEGATKKGHNAEEII